MTEPLDPGNASDASSAEAAATDGGLAGLDREDITSYRKLLRDGVFDRAGLGRAFALTPEEVEALASGPAPRQRRGGKPPPPEPPVTVLDAIEELRHRGLLLADDADEVTYG